MTRGRRRLLVGGFAALVLAVVTLVGARLAVDTPAAQSFVLARLVAALHAATGADVTIGRLGLGVVARTIELDDVRLAIGRQTIVRVSRAEITYAAAPLLRRRLLFRRIRLAGLRVRAVRDAQGWGLPRSEGAAGGGGPPIEVRALEIDDGRIAVALLDANPPRRLAAAALQLRASAVVEPNFRHLDVERLAFVPRGIAVSPVVGGGRLSAWPDSSIGVSSVGLATARTRITAGGRMEAGGRVSGKLHVAPLAASELRAVLPSVRLRSDVTATASAEGPPAALGIELTADAGPGGKLAGVATIDVAEAPPRFRASLNFAGLDPGAAVDGLARADAHGRLHARGRGTTPASAFAYRLFLRPSVVAGRAIDRVTLAGRARRGVHHARGEMAVAGNRAALRAAAVLAAEPRYRAEARLALGDLAALAPALPGWAGGRVSVKGRGTDPETRRAELTATVRGAELRGVSVSRAVVRSELRGTSVRLAEAHAEGPALQASVSGTLDTRLRTVEAKAEARLALDDVGTRVDRPLAGAASLSAQARGRFDALAVDASLAIEQGTYGATSTESATVGVHLAGLGGPSPTGSAILKAARLKVEGGSPHEVAMSASWRRAGPRTAGRLEDLSWSSSDGPPWRLVAPAAFTLSEGTLAVDSLRLASETQRVQLGGRAGLQGPALAVLEWEKVRLASLCALAEGPRCTGEVSGRIDLAGNAEAPRIDAALTADALTVDDVVYGDFQTTLHYADRAAHVLATLVRTGAGDLRIDGRVPVDLAWGRPRADTSAEPLALEARTDHLDLRFLRALAPRQLRESSGHLTARLHVGGSRAAPRADGVVALDDGRFDLVAAGVPYEEVRLRLRGSNAALTVEELRARSGDGTLAGQGSIALAGLRPSTLDLRLRLEDFLAVRQPAYEAVVSGPLAVSGTLSEPVIRGELEVSRAVVRPASLPVSKPPLHPDPTIEVVGGAAELAEAPPPGNAAAEALALTLRVRIARNAWIRRVDANIELGGDLTLDKQAHAPVGLTGHVDLRGGWYAFQGRRFTVEEGTIRFHGEVPPRPTFDVTAIHRTPLYRVEVHVSGSGEKPTLTLSSDPPLDQADILAVLLFGKPTHELGRGESVALQQQAVALGAGYVMPDVQASVMNALGLDTLDLALPQGSSKPGHVRAGRYVAQDVFVSLGQEFGKTNAQVVGIEYGLTPRVSVQASTSTRGTSAVDLFWHRRY